MSEPHDSSYYEVALTNKQVLTFFVVILVSLLVVFFAGVWVGRGASSEAVPVEVVAQADPDGAPSTDSGDLKELNFFSDPSAGSDLAAPAENTAKSDKKREAKRARSQPAPTQGEQEDPPPVAREEPAPAPPVRTASTASAGELLVIQVFSSADEDRATALTERLLAGGYSAYLSPVMVEGRTMHRVRIGPFRERAEAETVAREVEKAYQLSTWITR